MKLPRDTSGRDLVRALDRLGYHISHQTGSHIRLTRMGPPEHNVTVPDHTPLKIGTLSWILKDVAEHNGLEKDDLIRLLWG